MHRLRLHSARVLSIAHVSNRHNRLVSARDSRNRLNRRCSSRQTHGTIDHQPDESHGSPYFMRGTLDFSQLTPNNTKIAFIADTNLGKLTRSLYRMVRDEQAEAVFIQGDL